MVPFGCVSESHIEVQNVGNDTLVVDHLAFSATLPDIVADDLDPLIVQPRVELPHLLLGDLHLFQAGLDLPERQDAPLDTFGDQRPKFVELHDRRLVCQQHESVLAHTP